MRPLHVRLVVADPAREDGAALAAALRAAGHAVLTSVDQVVPLHVAPEPDFVVSDGASQPVPESLEAAEARHIAAVLRFTEGNRRKAASLLGVARSTLLAKIRKYRL